MTDLPKPKIVRSARRSIAIYVTTEREVVVRAPRLMPGFLIDRFINQRRDWIVESLQKIPQRVFARRYVDGERFWYLGNIYKFEVEDRTDIAISNGKLLFPRAAMFRAQKELEAWYIRQARMKIALRVEIQAARMNATYKSLMFSDTKSKWGTCNEDDSLQFNWRLVMAPLMVLDYVVIHELTHTKHKNHSREFWNHVRIFTPAYKQHRAWLNTNGHLLVV